MDMTLSIRMVQQMQVESVFRLKKNISSENFFTERKRALRYIHPRTLYVQFTVRVEAKLRC